MIYDWLITSVFRLSLTLCGVRAIIWLWSSPKLLPYFASLGTSPEYGSCLPRGIVRDWSKKNEISVLGRLESFLGQRLQEFVVTPFCNGQDTDRKTADSNWDNFNSLTLTLQNLPTLISSLQGQSWGVYGSTSGHNWEASWEMAHHPLWIFTTCTQGAGKHWIGMACSSMTTRRSVGVRRNCSCVLQSSF